MPVLFSVRLRTCFLFFAITLAAAPSTAVLAGHPSGSDWARLGFAAGAPSVQPGGPVTPRDLLLLRDLSGLSLSPGGATVAFSVRQAHPEQDDYRVAWFLAPVDGSAPPTDLGLDGGEPITFYSDGLPIGHIPDEIAKWSPDGRKLAVRRKVGDRIELWTVGVATGAKVRVHDGQAQVSEFAWLPSGVLFLRTGFNAERFREAVNTEGRHGWSLDARMFLFAAREPSPLPPRCLSGSTDAGCEIGELVQEPAGTLRPATAPEIAAAEAELRPRPPKGLIVGTANMSAKNADRDVFAWAETADPTKLTAMRPLRRVASDLGGLSRCRAPACVSASIREMGWSRSGTRVWFTKREDRDGGESGPQNLIGLYEWRPGSAHVRTVLRTDDALQGCVGGGRYLVCKRTAPTRPQHVVSIDLERRAVKELADPNPAFARKTFPRIRFLSMADPDGNPGYAQLVYPVDYRPGKTYPLVIVQYRTWGFLRAGVGEEYPIFPLADRGYFVLVVDRPEPRRERLTLSETESIRAGFRDRRDLDNTLSAYELTIRKLIAERLVDSDRVAITGLSAGAETVHHALQTSDLFAVAIASQGAYDLTWASMLPPTPRNRAMMAMVELDRLIPPEGHVIRKRSWSLQPERLRVPLLVNLNQYETYAGFEGLVALQHACRPIDVRIFPGEGHIKYRPSSYAGVFANNLAWLDFWLRDVEAPEPELAALLKKWRRLRDRLQAERTGTIPIGAPC